MARRAVIPMLVVAALLAAGCGSQQIDLDEGESQAVGNGAALFSEHCSGCHSLDAVGAEGSSVDAFDKETTDGPNFNDRRACEQDPPHEKGQFPSRSFHPSAPSTRDIGPRSTAP